jgi:uncharacterized damage-inducible protein DinB
MMKTASLLLVISCFASRMPAQTSPSTVGEVKQAYESIKNNLLKTAEKVPEADYSFKPTPEIRSLGEVLGHVIAAQSHACAAINGGEAPPQSKLDSKAGIQAGLQAAFAECDKAYNSLTDANASELIKTPRGSRTRLGALMGNVVHDTEQYGILSVYMRLKGIIPPSSERPGK